MRTAINTVPAVDPLTIDELKRWSMTPSVSTDGDTVLTELIQEATQYVEKLISWKILDQTWDIYLDACEFSIREAVSLPVAPTSAIVSVTSYGTDNTATVFSSSKYFLAGAYSAQPRLCLNYGEIWPTNLREFEALKITVTAGWGVDTDAVDAKNQQILRRLVAMVAAHLFNARGPEALEGGQTIFDVEMTADINAVVNRIRRFII